MPQLTQKTVTWLKPDPTQPRKHADEGDLQHLGQSLKERQNEPVQAKPDGTIIDGWRRWLAAKLVGLEKLDVIITEEALTNNQLRNIRLTSFFHKADLTSAEKWQACSELMCANPSWQMKDLAEHLHLDPSMVTRLLSPAKCIPEAQEALAAGKIGISDCYALSKLDPLEQPELLALKVAGASRDQIEQAGRKRRNGSTPAVRVSRIKCEVPGKGATVVVSGEAISLEEMIEAITELLREAKKANEKGLDAKTFERVCRDLAKKN